MLKIYLFENTITNEFVEQVTMLYHKINDRVVIGGDLCIVLKFIKSVEPGNPEI